MTRRNEKETTRTGRDILGGDGMVSDEDVKAISDANSKRQKKTGQDHSLEDHEKSMPTSGVGAVQDYSDTSTDIANINDKEA